MYCTCIVHVQYTYSRYTVHLQYMCCICTYTVHVQCTCTCTVQYMYSTYTVHVVDNLLNISYHYRSCLRLASEIVNTMFNKRTCCLLLGMYILYIHVHI